MTGTVGGTSKEKLYEKLGFESLKDSRWTRNFAAYIRSYLTFLSLLSVTTLTKIALK